LKGQDPYFLKDHEKQIERTKEEAEEDNRHHNRGFKLKKLFSPNFFFKTENISCLLPLL
jgi:hypothetical protein